MQNNRRKFFQQAGLIGSALGIDAIFPSAAFSQALKLPKENKIIASENHAVVETATGKVRGYSNGGIYTFKGIPYAASTAGAGRFMPAAKPVAWAGVRDTLVYGPVCPQRPNPYWAQAEVAFLQQWNDGYQNEDCLNLNIWSPGLNDGKKRAVMFWIHGGAFIAGSAHEHPSNDGENLSRFGDVVVVSINHRLNAFGYLDLSDYGSQYKASANVGMLDIVMALEWVRDNIENFGGDKNNVTIFGQSGGGAKVNVLMAMPSAKGLFHKAICQSNSIAQVSTHEYAIQQTAAILKYLNISSSNIAALHDIPAARLWEAGMGVEKVLGWDVPKNVGRAGLQAVVDGNILPEHPFDPGASALSANIPYMIGSCRNESSPSVNNIAIESLTEAGLEGKMNERFGRENGMLVYKTLRSTHPSVKPVEILSYISAQNTMSHLIAERKAAQQSAPVYLYMFGWHTPMLDGRPRAFHCSDMPFAFYNYDRCDFYTGGGAEAKKLSAAMAGAWVSFAKTGNPNHKGLAHWPSFNAQPGATMIFDNDCQVKIDPDGEARKLLERVIYKKEM